VIFASAFSSLQAVLDDNDDMMVECVAAECSQLSASIVYQQAASELPMCVNPVTVTDFVEVTVPSYGDGEFMQHFRMSRNCFEVNRQL